MLTQAWNDLEQFSAKQFCQKIWASWRTLHVVAGGVSIKLQKYYCEKNAPSPQDLPSVGRHSPWCWHRGENGDISRSIWNQWNQKKSSDLLWDFIATVQHLWDLLGISVCGSCRIAWAPPHIAIGADHCLDLSQSDFDIEKQQRFSEVRLCMLYAVCSLKEWLYELRTIFCVWGLHIWIWWVRYRFPRLGITDHVIVFWWVYYRFSRKMLKLQNQCRTVDYLVLLPK